MDYENNDSNEVFDLIKTSDINGLEQKLDLNLQKLE